MIGSSTNSLPVWQEGIGKVLRLSHRKKRSRSVLAGMTALILLAICGSYKIREKFMWGGECTRRIANKFKFFPGPEQRINDEMHPFAVRPIVAKSNNSRERAAIRWAACQPNCRRARVAYAQCIWLQHCPKMASTEQTSKQNGVDAYLVNNIDQVAVPEQESEY